MSLKKRGESIAPLLIWLLLLSYYDNLLRLGAHDLAMIAAMLD